MGTTSSHSQQETESFFTPLLISMACMVGTCVVIVAYHLFVVKYCLYRRRRWRRQVAEEILARQHLAAEADVANRSALGVEEKVLKTIPIFTYSAEKGHRDFRMDQGECAVCLGELDDGEAVRLLPSCRHAFHVTCIDQWFLAHSSCPVCRSPVTAPAVGETLLKLPAATGSGSSSDSVDPVLPERSSGVGLLRHCASSFVTTEAPWLPREDVGLKRSFSMVNPSHLVIDIEWKQEKASTSSSSSSSSQEALLGGDSTRRFDQVPSRLIHSLSQLRSGRTGCSVDSNSGLP